MSGCLRLMYLALALALSATQVAWAQDKQGYLGVDLQDLSKEEAERLGWETPRGTKVTRLRDGGPGAVAGINAQDVIISIDGIEVENMQRFLATVADKGSGAQVRLRVLRAGKERTITATLGRRPAEQAQLQKRELPILQLDTGGHTAILRGLVFTPDGKQIVSAGNDKVIRVWDWRAQKTVRTIRGQAGPGSEGKVFAMAISPDGKWLAVGGWTNEICAGRCGDIRLYDFEKGTLDALLTGHSNVTLSLAFSPDGRYLLSGSGLGEPQSIIWNLQTRKPLHILKGHTKEVTAVTFAVGSTRAVTASDDLTVRLWNVSDGKEVAVLRGHQQKLTSVAASPVDDTIASGGDEGEIKLWDARSARALQSPIKQGGYVGSLRFSRDGRRLLTTCGYSGCSYTQLIWEVATGKQVSSYAGHDNIVVTASMNPDGRLVATGGSKGEVHIWDINTGKSVNDKSQDVLAGKGSPVWGVGISQDGRRVAWGNTSRSGWKVNDYAVMAFEMRLPGSTGQGLGRPELLPSQGATTFLHARPAHGAYALMHRRGGVYGYYDALLDIKQDGRLTTTIELGSTSGFQHRSYTFSMDGQTVVSGGDGGVLSAYDLTGKRIGSFVGHEGDVWAVAPSNDGRLLVTGSGDQTLRIWNIKTRELIATLFNSTDNEWVMWTPQGYYTGSPGSDKIVGWQINKGAESTADYVGADQLRIHLNRPDIVEKAIILASAEQAVQESHGTTFKLADLLARPVPRFRILSPATGSTQVGGRVTVRIDVEAIRDPMKGTVLDPIKAMRVQVNGRQVSEITADVGSGGLKTGEQDLDVPLAKGRNEVRITLTNEIGDKTETLTLNHDGEGALDKRGTLYILAIGVDRYPKLGNTCGEFNNQSCDLRYSGADASRLAAAAEKRLRSEHSNVVKRVLINGAGPNEAPTARNIIDAIDLLKDAQETDTILLFIAGHGVNDGPSYRFLATDAERAGASFRGVTVVPWQVLQEAVEAAKGRRILFLDTCHSGNAYNQKLGNAAYHANIITYTSARFDQEALEDAQLGHGLFTYAVVEGLEGKGEFASKREISTQDLALFVVKRVDQLAKAMRGAQEPQYFKGRDAQDYVLARW